MTFQSINPATGELIESFPEMSDAELETAISCAQACYETDWRRRAIADRARVLTAAAAKLRANAAEYARYATLDMGKLTGQALGEIALSANILDYYAQRAESFLKPQIVPEVPTAVVETHPIGIIFGIEPWNFPYYQVARVAGPQLMVGNVVIIKHAESVPQCALALARLFEEAGAPAGAYTNVFISHQQSSRVIDDRRVRGVTVTGSERAGAVVAERAGHNLKKSVMELGGSDPFVVLEDAPLDSALDHAVSGRMFNAGQSCVSSKRFIVVGKERGKVFLEELAGRMAVMKIGDPTDPETMLGPVSSERAMNGLLRQIAVAEESGARVVLGGHRVNRPGFYVEPTILADVDERNPIYTQELFGPVASVYVVDGEEEAIAVANATPFGLGGSVFTADLDRGRRIADRIDSGMVWVNSPTQTRPELPFGGVKNSGFGRELSEFGFSEFVNRKLIHVSPVGTPPRPLAAAPR